MTEECFRVMNYSSPENCRSQMSRNLAQHASVDAVLEVRPPAQVSIYQASETDKESYKKLYNGTAQVDLTYR
jgi:hypothetical protein